MGCIHFENGEKIKGINVFFFVNKGNNNGIKTETFPRYPFLRLYIFRKVSDPSLFGGFYVFKFCFII